jgi:hypothetical protein
MKSLVLVLSILVSFNVFADRFKDAATGITANQSANIGNSILFRDVTVEISASVPGLIPVENASTVCHLLKLKNGTVNKTLQTANNIYTVVVFNSDGTVESISGADEYASTQSNGLATLITDLTCDKP